MDKRYNLFLRQRISLNEGERFCPKCDGKGKIPRPSGSKQYGMTSKIMLVCSECLGDGKIDWVEEVVGKKRKVIIRYEYTSDAEL